MNRKSSKFRSVDMTYGRMERIKAMLPLMHRANAKGMNINQAAKWLGWSPSCVRNWTRITGFQWKNRRKRRGYKFDKTGWEAKILELRAQGKTHAQIAAALGVGEWNVSRFIKDNGLQIANRKNRLMP